MGAHVLRLLGLQLGDGVRGPLWVGEWVGGWVVGQYKSKKKT